MMSPGAGIRGTFQEDITPKETDGESSGTKRHQISNFLAIVIFKKLITVLAMHMRMNTVGKRMSGGEGGLTPSGPCNT